MEDKRGQELKERRRFYSESQVIEMIRISEERAYFRGIIMGDTICYKNGIGSQMEDFLLISDNKRYEENVPYEIRKEVDLGHKTKAFFKKEFVNGSLPIERENPKEKAVREIKAEQDFPNLLELYKSNKDKWYRKPEECEEQNYESSEIEMKSL